MQFIKNLFKDNSVVGLCALKKKNEYVFIEIPKAYKKTYVTNTKNNFILI